MKRDYQQWRAVGADARRMVAVDVEEHELVWIVSWTSEEFVRPENPEFMLVGTGLTWSTVPTEAAPGRRRYCGNRGAGG